jgi:ligand-binding sensor domain-containing protein
MKYRTARRTRFAHAALHAVTILAIATPDLAAQRRAWTGDDRILIGSGALVLALALGPREVFAATPTGILVYDFTTRRWKPPLAPVENYPAQDEVTALAYDRVSAGLWLGTRAGDLYSYTPGFGRWERHAMGAQGEVLAIAADAATGDLFVATPRQWLRIEPGSSFSEPIAPDAAPPAVREILDRTRAQRDPALEAVRGTLGLDAELRRWEITDIVEGERPGEYWVATAGGGVLHFDRTGMDREWIPFGIVSRGTAAIGFDGERLWFGGDGRGPRNGVAAANASLEQWWSYDAATERAPAGFVAEILATQSGTWFAASDGLYLATSEADAAAAEWQRWTAQDGLPSDEVTTLAAAEDVLWAGTRRGVAAIDDNGRIIARLVGAPVHRVAARNDTLWVAGDDGLWIVPGAASNTRRAAAQPAPGADANAALSGRIADVVVTPDGVHVLIGDGLFSYSGGSWRGPERDATLEAVGPPLRLAFDSGRLWVAGGRGVAFRESASGAWQSFEVPGDIPVGPALDVLPVGEHVWIATPAGGVRLRWR